jgi:hypothetical protein
MRALVCLFVRSESTPLEISSIYQFKVNKVSIQFTYYDITPIDQTSTALPYLFIGEKKRKREMCVVCQIDGFKRARGREILLRLLS